MKRLLIEYQVFLSRIEEIQVFLEKVDKNAVVEKIENEFSTGDKDVYEYIRFMKTLGSSQLGYNAIIISLYGCFENYIDKLLGSYLELLLEAKTNYDDLPKKLVEKYRFKFGEYLCNPQRFLNLDLELYKEVDNYHRLLDSVLSGTMSKSFALSHSGNLHPQEIFALLSDLGIEGPKDKVMDSELFKSYYIANGMEYSDFKVKRSRRSDEFFAPIEDLITQRNLVAHSWNVQNRKTLHEINTTIIPFVIMFCECLFRVCAVQAFLLRNDWVLLKIGTPINVIKNRVVCMNSQNQYIAVGDYIIYQSNNKVKIARIENMQENGVDLFVVEATDSKNIGLQLDNTIRITDNLKMFVNHK